MNIAIIGFGVEGHAAFRYYSRPGNQITICDQNIHTQIPLQVAGQLGAGYLRELDKFDLIFRSNGVNPSLILRENPNVADKITTSVNEFLKLSPTKHIIGVTGTKGKGTTSTLIAKMLEAAGEHVLLGGNIGVSAFDLLPNTKPDSWVVLELSSFQLVDVKLSPSIAVCLMVVPEHLNWHDDMDDYITAKSRLFEHQTQSDTAIYYAASETSREIAAHGQGLKIPFYAEPGAHIENGGVTIAGEQVCQTDELRLLGQHNWQNVCAAVTCVWQITQNIDAFRSVLTTFAGLPHRLEFVREVGGVNYYNDSFAATPDAAIAALDAITAPKVVIMGGFDRGLPLDHLAKAVLSHKNDIRKLIIIGASGTRLAIELEKAGFADFILDPSKTMSEVLATTKIFSVPGDAVLLSPGFASFDMFKNFENRGNDFRQAVEQLA